MSKFYGTVTGAGKTAATRRGHNDIRTAAQSFDGSLITRLYYDDNDALRVELRHCDGSGTDGVRVYDGNLSELVLLLSNTYHRLRA